MAIRYVNPNSTAGGDGTTNATVGANRAYVSLSAWEAARQAVLAEVEECICETGGNADTTQLVIDGWTTTSSNYIYIHPSSGHRHAGVYNTAKFRLEVSIVFNDALRVIEDFVRIEGLQVRQTDATADAYAAVYLGAAATCDVRVEGCIVRNASTGTSARQGAAIAVAAAGTYTVRNCVTYACRYGLFTAQGFAGTMVTNADNCTFIASVNGVIRNDSETLTLRNCYAHGATDAYSGTMTRTTCAHSSATVFTGSTASIAHSTANFLNVTGGSEDYHLQAAASSTLLTGGTDLSGTFTTDIDGETRSAPWSIGADEIVSATATSRPVFQPARRITITRRRF